MCKPSTFYASACIQNCLSIPSIHKGPDAKATEVNGRLFTSVDSGSGAKFKSQDV